MELDTIHHMAALDLLERLPNQSVDMALLDLPYQVTECSWDILIPIVPMWKSLHRVLKPGAACVMTSVQPFSSMLVMSNLSEFRYEWVWRKSLSSGHLNAKRQPMPAHETVLVFSEEGPTYNPQLRSRTPHGKTKNGPASAVYGEFGTHGVREIKQEEGYPTSVLEFNTAYHDREAGLHPTQKPVRLFEYLIRTYSNPGQIVLDFAIGSGTTAVAARNLDRHFIGCDNGHDEKTGRAWSDIASERVRNTDPFQSRVVAPGIEQPSLFMSVSGR